MFSTACTVGGMDLEPTSKRRLIWVMDFYCRHLLWGFLDLIYESSLWKVLTLKLFGAGLHLEYRHAFDRFSNTVSWSLLGNKLIAITWKLSWAGLYLRVVFGWSFPGSCLWLVFTWKLSGAGLYLVFTWKLSGAGLYLVFTWKLSWAGSLPGNCLGLDLYLEVVLFWVFTWKLSWAGLYLEDILFWVFTWKFSGAGLYLVFTWKLSWAGSLPGSCPELGLYLEVILFWVFTWKLSCSGSLPGSCPWSSWTPWRCRSCLRWPADKSQEWCCTNTGLP